MIYITQWICEKRHCLFAVPWQASDASHKDIELLGEFVMILKKLPMRCTICEGRWLIEHGKTDFKDMAEAVHEVLSISITTHLKRQALKDLQDSARN